MQEKCCLTIKYMLQTQDMALPAKTAIMTLKQMKQSLKPVAYAMNPYRKMKIPRTERMHSIRNVLDAIRKVMQALWIKTAPYVMSCNSTLMV